MVKRSTRKTRRLRGGVWYNPLTWFSSAPEPVPTQPETTTPPAPSPAPTPAPAPTPYGGKKGRKTRRGGRHGRSQAKRIYARSH